MDASTATAYAWACWRQGGDHGWRDPDVLAPSDAPLFDHMVSHLSR
jgi:hypothetical protein